MENEKISMSQMKNNIAKAGNLFYQYRPCRRDASIIYDIENIRHGVVFARTPLQMNDPYDSMVGFSVEKIYEECIEIVLNQVDTPLESDIKLIVKILLKYRMIGKMLELVNVLNQLKKYIILQSVISHVQPTYFAQFIKRDLDKLYKKCPAEIKKYLNKDAFYIFSLVIKDYQNIDIEENTIVEALELEDVLKKLEVTVVKVRDEIYLPFLKEFLSKVTVTCFSASGWDNQLMWSHYANAYSGICVEYDFEKMDKFIGFVYPVKYSSDRPAISLKDLGISELKKDENGKLITQEVNINAIFSYLLAKNTCWSYEEEWRIINVEGEPYTPLFVNVPFVKSITLGLNLDEMCKQLIWDVCQERNIDCYQLVINSSDYHLSRELLSDEMFVFDKDREEQYFTLLSEQTVSLGEKIVTNSNSLSNSIGEGNFESTSMMNILSFTLDYLCDVYFLKRSFNRYCKNVDVPLSEISGDTEIGKAISQIDEFLHQTKNSMKTIDESLFNLRLQRKITSSEYHKAKNLIADNKEMLNKHDGLNWYVQ